MQTITQIFNLLAPFLIVLLPFIAFGVSYAWQTASKSVVMNGSIAGGTILVASVLTALLQGKLTGSVATDTTYVLSLATALQVETFRPLQGYLRGDPPVQPGQVLSVDPKPITLPDRQVPPVA